MFELSLEHQFYKRSYPTENDFDHLVLCGPKNILTKIYLYFKINYNYANKEFFRGALNIPQWR